METKLNLSGAADSEECGKVSQGRSLWLYTKQALPAPIERNEPNLSSALSAISRVIERRGKAGISRERTILLGFSQGACLALEFAARNPQRFGGFVGLSGGLIGPEGTLWNYPGSLADTPVFLGCSGPDPHIPRGRMLESAKVLQDLGAEVTSRLYPGTGHTINQDS